MSKTISIIPTLIKFDDYHEILFFQDRIQKINSFLKCKEIDQTDNKIIGLVYWKNEFPTDEEIEILLEEFENDN